jgi:hypothetical protein
MSGRNDVDSLSPQAVGARIKLVPDRAYKVVLTGEQLRMLLGVLSAAHFRGSEVFLAGDVISALQKPILDDAHGSVIAE